MSTAKVFMYFVYEYIFHYKNKHRIHDYGLIAQSIIIKKKYIEKNDY
jgi:hypothetical protein